MDPQEEICHFASQLRVGVPAKLPLDAKGLPLAPLPAGFWLPFPTLEDPGGGGTLLGRFCGIFIILQYGYQWFRDISR